MPKCNFESKKIKTVLTELPNKQVKLPVKDGISKTDSFNHIAYDYDIINVTRKLDRNKTYYSKHFKSIILFSDFEAKSYNILTKYNPEKDAVDYYICLYADVVDGAVKTKRDYTSGYKIYIEKVMPHLNKDMNIDTRVEERRDNPNSIIYKIY